MRVILAGLFVVVGIFLVFLLLGPWLERLHPLLSMLLIAVIAGVGFLGLCLAALVIFNAPDIKIKQAAEYDKQVREWEAQGLLTVTNYKFTRALRADEDEAIEEEDEDSAEVSGPHYFFELDNGSVLYLCGHYLSNLETFYDNSLLDGASVFNPVDLLQAPDAHQVTNGMNYVPFPAGNMGMGSFAGSPPFFLTVKRHQVDDRIVQVLCNATAPVLARVPSTFWDNPYWQTHFPNDGDIITERTYDELLAGA